MNAPKFDLAALKNIDFSKVIAIAKQRGVLIACTFIIVVIPVVAWWFRGGIKDSIHETMSKRSKEFDKIVSLEKSAVTVRNPVGDPKSETVSLNSTLIDALKARNESLENEVKGVYRSAVEHNKKNHDIIQTKQVVFPKPLQENEKLLEEIFLPAIGPAYTVLLANNRVNTPPSSADVLEAVKQREISFIRDDLKKKNRSEVTDPKEIEQLAQALTKARLDALVEGARDTAVYLDKGAVRMPPAKGFISVDTCFTWQWDLWVLDDIFHAITNVNTNLKDGVKSSVISSPVKRIISIRIDQPSSVAATSATAEAPPVETEATDAPEEGAEPVAVVVEATTDATGEPIAPASEIIRDFKISFTGLKSCQLYDVRNVKLKLIVSTSDLPKVLDSFAKENFMTVTQLKISPVDSFAAARQGFIYGAEPCSEVSMVLQTIWLREWTTFYMPLGMKNKLGTRGIEKPPAAEAGPDAGEAKSTSETTKS
jgi:hypothetical protein